MTKEDKLMLHRYGAFIVILLVMFFSLFIFLRLETRFSSWNKGLAVVVNQVLSENESTRGMVVLEAVDMKLSTSVSAAMFLVGNTDVVEGYTVVLRLTGPSGPLSGVFYTKNVQQTPVFIGMADTYYREDTTRKIKRSVAYSDFQLTTAQISFWSDKASLYLQEVITQ